MSIRRRGQSFQVQAPGESARSFPTRAAAEKYEMHLKLKRSLGYLYEEAPITVAEALDGYVQRWQARSQPQPSSVKRAQESLRFLKAEFGDVLLSHMSVVQVEDAFAARAHDHPSSAKRELEWLKRALRDAQRRRQAFDPGLLLIDPVRARSRQGVALDLDDLDRLGSWFPDHLSLFPHIVGSLALRIGEALGLTDDRVDIKGGTVFVPFTKEQRPKLIELTGTETALLAEQLMARPAGTEYVFPRAGGQPSSRGGRPHMPGKWDKGDFYARVWHPAREAAARDWREERGLPVSASSPFDTIVPHDLRHTGISHMAAAGMGPELIAARVGHKDGGRLILERYRHLFKNEMSLALDKYEAYKQSDRERKVAEA